MTGSQQARASTAPPSGRVQCTEGCGLAGRRSAVSALVPPATSSSWDSAPNLSSRGASEGRGIYIQEPRREKASTSTIRPEIG